MYTCSYPQHPTATAKNVEVVLVKTSILPWTNNLGVREIFIYRGFTCVETPSNFLSLHFYEEVIMPMFQGSAGSAVNQKSLVKSISATV